MKVCTKCNLEKEESDFIPRSGRPGKLHAQCRDCHNERMRQRTRNTAKIIDSVLGTSCTLCGYNKCSSALEMHHKDPSQKEFNLSRSRSYSVEKIMSEISKCVLLCANCHREVHAGISEI